MLDDYNMFHNLIVSSAFSVYILERNCLYIFHIAMAALVLNMDIICVYVQHSILCRVGSTGDDPSSERVSE